MTIAVGDRIPDAQVWVVTREGAKSMPASEALGRGRVVLFGVPGAFTPTCSDHHLPGFLLRADDLQAKGVDTIACMAVNDPFVMAAWGKDRHVDGKIVLVSDGNADLTKAMGLELDGSGFGLGTRNRRFAAVLEDGVVTQLNVEEGGGVDVSSAEKILASL